MDATEYIVLYTHQKTKKAKKWQDGRLKITQTGKIELFDDSHNKVETVYVKAEQIRAGEEIESDRHLITIEEAISIEPGDVSRLDQGSIKQISEEKNERIQPVCSQPLRKRRMGFTVPRQTNRPTATADSGKNNENLQCSQTSVGRQLNSELRQSLPQSFETGTSLLSSPLFSSNPHQNQTSSIKIFSQDCNTSSQEEATSSHNQLNKTGHLSNRSQLKGNTVSNKQNAFSEVRTQGCRNELTESENGRGATYTGGKRSASQILALIGKQKNNFQPPIKRLRPETVSEGNKSYLEDMNTFNKNPDSYHLESDSLKEENVVHPLEKDAQKEASDWTDEGSWHNFTQQQKMTGMFENCNLHASTSPFSKSIMLSPLKSSERKAYFQNDFLRVGEDGSQICDINLTGNKRKNGKGEECHTVTTEKKKFKGAGECEKISSEEGMKITTNSMDQPGTVISEPHSSVEVCGSFGIAYIHRTKEGDNCGDIEVNVRAKKWTGQLQSENIAMVDDAPRLNGNSEVKQESTCMSTDCSNHSFGNRELEINKTLEEGQAVDFTADNTGIPEELSSLDKVEEDYNQVEVQEDGESGVNETVDEYNIKGRGQFVGRGNCVTTLRNKQSTSFDMMEKDGNETNVRNEESGIPDTVNECSIIKGMGQCIGRKGEDGSVTALGNGQLRCSYQEDIKMTSEAGDMKHWDDGENGKRSGFAYPDGDAVDGISGKVSCITDTADNIHAGKVSKDTSNKACFTSITPRVHADSEEEVRDSLTILMHADGKDGFGGSRHTNHGDSMWYVDARGCDIPSSGADQEDDFNDGNNGGQSMDATVSSFQSDSLVSRPREVNLTKNKDCVNPVFGSKTGNNMLQNRNDKIDLSEAKYGQVPDPLQSVYVTQSTVEDEHCEDSQLTVSSEEEGDLSNLLKRGESSQSQEGNTISESIKSTVQNDGGSGQQILNKNHKKYSNGTDATKVVPSSENYGMCEDVITDNHSSRNNELENLQGGLMNIAKHVSVPSSLARSKLSEGWEESTSDGMNTNSQTSLLSVTTTDTLESSLSCSQQDSSGLELVAEAVKSGKNAGKISTFFTRDKTTCKPGKDWRLLHEEDGDSLTNTRRSSALMKSDKVAGLEDSAEYDVLEMLKACLDRTDPSELVQVVSTTLDKSQVLNQKSEASPDSEPQMVGTTGCIPLQTVSEEAWLPSSPKAPLLSDLGGRYVVSGEEDISVDDCHHRQMSSCIANSSSETFLHEDRDGDTSSQHQLIKELASSSALQRVTNSLPESTPNIHQHKKFQTHYWYQPLASNVVRRCPPAPTVTFASTCRTDFQTLNLRSLPEDNEELSFMRQDKDEKMMSHLDSLNSQNWDCFIPVVKDQRKEASRQVENERDAAGVLGDDELNRRVKRHWMYDGEVGDDCPLPQDHCTQGETVDKDTELAGRRNTQGCLTSSEENWDDIVAATSRTDIQRQSTMPAFLGEGLSGGSDLSTLQSHRDLLQELGTDTLFAPTSDDMMTTNEVDYFHPESPVLPLFADVRNTCKSNVVGNSSPFQKVPSSSQEYLQPLVTSAELFFQDAETCKGKKLCTPCFTTTKESPSCKRVLHEMFGSEGRSPYHPVSKSFLPCGLDHLTYEHGRVVLQQNREHLLQHSEATYQVKMRDHQCKSETEQKEEHARLSHGNEEHTRNGVDTLDSSRDSLEQEATVPDIDLSQEVDEIDSQMDLFLSQRDEDEHKRHTTKKEEIQDETADGEHKVMSECLDQPSLTQRAKGEKRPLVAKATEDYQSSQFFVRRANVTFAEEDQDQEYSQSMNNVACREESYLSFENYGNSKPTVYTQRSECSVDAPVNKLVNQPPHWKKTSLQKQSGPIIGKRRPLHQMQTAFQSPSPCSSVSSQSGKFHTPTMKKLNHSSGSQGINLSGDLVFPSLEDTSSAVVPERQVRIPTVFQDAACYKQVLTAVLKEHLNIILFEVARNFFTALSKVDVSSYSSTKSVTKGIEIHNPPCQHKQPSKKVCVKKEGANKGRFFFTCSNARGNQCKFFQWADQKTQGSSKGQQHRPSKEVLSDAKSIEMYMKSFGVSLYCECQLLRKSPFPDNIPGAPAWIKKYRQRKLNTDRKKLYLRLSRKEGSSVYGKDDLWVISKDLRFDSSQSFLAKSVFHGPSSSSELEIEPLSGYSPSIWSNEALVHAIHAYNASTELSCLDNIKDFVNPRILPVLPALLKWDHTSNTASQSQTSFKSPAIAPSLGRKLHCTDDQIHHLANLVVAKYNLNEDQAEALRCVGEMLTSEGTGASSVNLIHGVFGAGKSYLLAVTVLFLTQVFHLHQEAGGDPKDWKVLISSTTNVAVDRILLSLLELGFEEFIRVGSMRKIAKPVLPYSVHASDKSNQELKELQDMLRGDLSPAEKNFVRKSIERQRLGLNKEMLSKVLVVGVTCAACTFPCIHNLKFPVVLLDECSQITEPACLLPIARFECQKLVLVGDPKQLDPTIQGSESTHDTSLEQTLFDRLLLMGYQPTLLRTQYRCHPLISAIANELFYENKLLDGVTEEQRVELAEGFPTLCFFNVANGKECCTTGGSYLNDKEGVFVVTMIEMLVGSGVEPSQIGVITLYKAQVAHITVLLQQSRLSSMKEIKAIQISTVDAFQGGEKDIIILSCVRTDFMGFAASDKRTNVALTRSRNHLLIVGNQKILSANSLWKRVIAKCRECKKGIQDSRAVLEEWAPKLAEFRQAEMEKKKQSKSKKPKKTDPQNTVLTIQSERAASPPISLESTVDEQDQSVPEVILISTPSNLFPEGVSDSLPPHNEEKYHSQHIQSIQADNVTVEVSDVDIFSSNHRLENGKVSEFVTENCSGIGEESHQWFNEVSYEEETKDGLSKSAEKATDNDLKASKISEGDEMLVAGPNGSPSYSPLEDGGTIDSNDSEDELPNFDFDFEM